MLLNVPTRKSFNRSRCAWVMESPISFELQTILSLKFFLRHGFWATPA